ncbi:hypothetical protein ACFQAS_07730 [Halopenitus salinus]|uniref:Major facilitator superfamily (MFS) profile domain-containing protein n=1 Tax=Halopenitus salinus TaxID=1198295 RepID=A0ABD5UVR7_9EURY
MDDDETAGAKGTDRGPITLPPNELVERLALPFVLGMALGLSIGRFLGGLVVGVPLGLVLFVAFGWLRLKLAELPQ